MRPFLTRLAAIAKQEALDECSRCKGRENGDCGGEACRYWPWTATEAERDAGVKRYVARTRNWDGPVCNDDDGMGLEVE
jgi:hypothetical protein